PQVEPGGPGQMRRQLVARPRGSLQPEADRLTHQPVPRRVELDLVYPVPITIVTTQHGRVLVGGEGLCERLFGPRQRADPAQSGVVGETAVRTQSVSERRVQGEEVHSLEWGRLVRYRERVRHVSTVSGMGRSGAGPSGGSSLSLAWVRKIPTTTWK